MDTGGMWRRVLFLLGHSVLRLKSVSSQEHAAEPEERMRKQAEHDAKAREKATREDMRRLTRAQEEERTKRRRAREKLRAQEAREFEETRRKAVLAPSSAASPPSESTT